MELDTGHDDGSNREEALPQSKSEKLPNNLAPRAKRAYCMEPFVRQSVAVELNSDVDEAKFRAEIRELGGDVKSFNALAHVEIEAQMLPDIARLGGVVYVEVGGAFGPAGSYE